MVTKEIYECKCHICQSTEKTPNQKKAQHQQINVFMSLLDERERRWYAGLMVKQIGHGGETHISQITGLDRKTIRRGRRELDEGLQDLPIDKIRKIGAGRPRKKKQRDSSAGSGSR